MKVGDLVIYKGDVCESDPNVEYTPGIVIALYCDCNKAEERWWIEGGCRCCANILWAGAGEMM